MRKLITATFVTLDGVLQGEGGPGEDTSGGFTQSGWTAKYNDDMVDQVIDGYMKVPFELLLGRKTYDVFAAYWPITQDDPNIAGPFNATKKYVVSHRQTELTWAESHLVTGEVVSEIRKLKEIEAPDLWVWGSGNLIQTLLGADLVDEMRIWTYPLTVGDGKRLFAGGSIPAAFKLAESQVTPGGVIIAHYERTGK